MGDLISRQAVLDYPIRLDHYDKENGNRHFVLGIESVMEYVEYLPSADAVEVVRCKDCMYRHEDECPMQFEEQFDIDEGDGYYDTNYIVHDYTQDDGFCSWGERMSND